LNNLYYITYQNFPDYTANSRQTLSNIKYFLQEGYKVELIFPLRSEQSSSKIKNLQNFYNFEFTFRVKGIEHPYPFGKWKYFIKTAFHLSHMLWANKIINKSNFKATDNDIVFTRSDWVFYFAAKKNINVTFECHSLTKLRKLLLRRTIKKVSAKVIFLNSFLQEDSGIKDAYLYKSRVIHNGFDSELFKESSSNGFTDEVFIFTGNLVRHGSMRNFDYIFEAFKDVRFKNKSLMVVGANTSQLELYNKIIEKQELTNKVFFMPFSNARKTIELMEKATFGLLVNNGADQHSKFYSSPLKYFEYLRAGLNVLAVNLPSHNVLPYSDHIYYFEENDTESFINAALMASASSINKPKNIEELSLSSRVHKIKKFLDT